MTEPITSVTTANSARYARGIQSTVPPSTMDLPNVAENVTGLTDDIALIQAGKFACGKSAVLENMSGIVMKLDITPGVCQSVLETVNAMNNDEKPRPRKNRARIQPIQSTGLCGKLTPNKKAAKTITGS